MTNPAIAQVLENIYASLNDNNRDIDTHIAALKTTLSQTGEKVAVFEPARLSQNNRQGRKLMQSYFKKRGVTVAFSS